jgi:hypothetical protein
VIVVDTNVLYALADRRDKHHAECTEWFRRNEDVLLVLPTVVAEACYLIDRYLGPAAEAAFLDSVGTGDNYVFQLAAQTFAAWPNSCDATATGTWAGPTHL